ncbi:hypothetical protein NDU88_002444 [Pleurodeles waltl]|uniref:Uncharacterized protein n=1 Tax=Pleurodeles waltl TaxID=8319 RepID=A0AAV7PFA5_PLEWA|nr:hypothetical protein NDU88_002444 [Pleurodeles waltl]
MSVPQVACGSGDHRNNEDFLEMPEDQSHRIDGGGGVTEVIGPILGLESASGTTGSSAGRCDRRGGNGLLLLRGPAEDTYEGGLLERYEAPWLSDALRMVGVHRGFGPVADRGTAVVMR